MRNTTLRRLARSSAALTTAGALVIGGASVALADPGRGPRGPMGEQSQSHGGPLASLVSAGTITSAEASAVSNALRSAHDARRAKASEDHESERSPVLDALVAKGTITRAQAQAIAGAERGGMRSLLENGIITQAQAEALRTAMSTFRDQAREARDAERASETRAALAKLVADGTLTQAKADAIAAALAQRPGDHGPRMGKGSRRD